MQHLIQAQALSLHLNRHQHLFPAQFRHQLRLLIVKVVRSLRLDPLRAVMVSCQVPRVRHQHPNSTSTSASESASISASQSASASNSHGQLPNTGSQSSSNSHGRLPQTNESNASGATSTGILLLSLMALMMLKKKRRNAR
ncbi:LPXTG cell wall anchor domain-containing protein [Lacticaseibacillus paracasei]|uniref:LPXTG cell wall anchor domain-containing protein n=1 Tax=Lacticaseibacillus paracasei TaxID=1597 RepID=UPI00339970BA